MAGFTVRDVPEADLWSWAPGDATAETIVDETSWDGAAAPPGQGRATLTRWMRDGAWVLGLYAGRTLIGLFDVGRFVPGDYGNPPADGAGDRGADLGRPVGLRHLTIWFAIRPSERGQIPGATFKALSDAFLRHVWDLGIRSLVTTHVLNVEAGRRHAARVERLGWRTVSRRGLVEVKVKTLERRP